VNGNCPAIIFSRDFDWLQRDDPDLVVLDMLLPDFDGLEITRLIRQTSQVPILILSARDETSTKVAALDLGAADYLTKPFRVEELLARMRAILRRVAPSGLDSTHSSNV